MFKAERGWRCVFAGLISLLAASISCDVAFEDIDDGDAAADTDTWPLSAGWDGASFALGALPDTANQIIENNFLESKLGIAVSGAGDVNGDGYDDVIVGAPEFFGYFGAAYVYPGSATGIQTTSLWSDGGASALAEFGASVARAGDVNGDGYDDIVVGAPFDEVVGWVGVYKGYWNGVLSSPTDLNHSETTYSLLRRVGRRRRGRQRRRLRRRHRGPALYRGFRSSSRRAWGPRTCITARPAA
ncbi:MAG: integrin alpha [Deltaproteobacteria bacterium]|nr:integrin alpha [Deltaproteobacteria bacterium]